MRSKLYSIDRADWFICDFETLTANTDYYKKYNATRVILWGAQNYGNIDSEIEKGTSIEQFFKWLHYLKRPATLFFHNLTFDGDFIIKFLVRKGVRLINEPKRKHSKKEYFTFFKNKRRIYYIIYNHAYKEQGKKHVYKYVFRCSLLLLSAGVEALGKNINIAKHENGKENTFYDWEPWHDIKKVDRAFLDYMERDIKIVNQSLFEFETIFLQDESVKKIGSKFSLFNHITGGAVGQKLLTQIYLKRFIGQNKQFKNVNFLAGHDNAFFRKALSGGWTQFNEKYQNENLEKIGGKIFDIISSYPYQMTQALPYGALMENKPEQGTFTQWVRVFVASAKIKEKYRDLVVLKNWKRNTENLNRYVRSLNNFECYYNIDEWEFINEIYNIEILEIDLYYQKTAKYMEEFMRTYFNHKKTFSSQKLKARAHGIKIIINSQFGKLCQRDEYETMLYTKNDYEKGDIIEMLKGDTDDEFKYFEVLRESTAYDIGGNLKCFFLKEQDKNGKTRNVAAGAWITSQARLMMWKAIKHIGVDNFIYSDTDSIFIKNDKLEKWRDLKIGSELGMWEHEKDFTRFKTFGAKRYFAFNDNYEVVKNGFAGTNINIKKLLDYTDFDKESFAIEGGKVVVKGVIGGTIITKQDLNINKGTI